MKKAILFLLVGLGFSGIATAVANLFGLNSTSFTVILYLFPMLGLLLWGVERREKNGDPVF